MTLFPTPHRGQGGWKTALEASELSQVSGSKVRSQRVSLHIRFYKTPYAAPWRRLLDGWPLLLRGFAEGSDRPSGIPHISRTLRWDRRYAWHRLLMYASLGWNWCAFWNFDKLHKGATQTAGQWSGHWLSWDCEKTGHKKLWSSMTPLMLDMTRLNVKSKSLSSWQNLCHMTITNMLKHMKVVKKCLP